ncbi:MULTISPECIES: DUF4230 domain-containing protein [unclassified Coleofasciculus]|uniref:DUF4230 domain-containing protein n=1 Tax=unclassified Coleofasciculus TaxID=2692782 RepID=UPI00187EB897|nr:MULTISPECIES: DUF4230 domain-containing protein [unclassified Coleofasciculus]MBE9129778.1 DUF4230 domain-containing protein [Coleofasciculus sp. LEGE 07081]MBE9150381.1 DUF4230 domain-containing protein [Coleofasciculus sp. LEGE 07092]
MNHQFFQKYRIDRLTFGLFRNLMLMTTGGMVVVALIFGIGMWRTGSRFFEQVTAMFNVSQPAPEVDVRSLVVQQVRGASELTTAVFTMEAVVPTRQARTVAGYPIAETTLLYIAYGEVRAGVDLEELKPENVAIVDDTIQIQLPPPRILDSKIDVNRSQVYDYNRGFLGLGPDTAPQLQSLAQQETLQKILFNACNQGLLQEANTRSQLVVSQLLTTAGYKNVEVKTQPPQPETCM